MSLLDAARSAFSSTDMGVNTPKLLGMKTTSACVIAHGVELVKLC
jgi:hypothetical protein